MPLLTHLQQISMYRPNQPPPYKDINVSLLAPQNFPIQLPCRPSPLLWLERSLLKKKPHRPMRTTNRRGVSAPILLVDVHIWGERNENTLPCWLLCCWPAVVPCPACMQSADHRQEVLLQLLGRDGLWTSFSFGGLLLSSFGRDIGAPVLDPSPSHLIY